MGNKSMSTQLAAKASPPKKHFEPVENFKFLEPFLEDDNNGLYLNNIYFPEEIIFIILSYIPPKDILKVSEVCKRWFNIVRSESFWFDIYQSTYSTKPIKGPWYAYYCLFTTKYFNSNLIKNGNGQDSFKHWKIIKNYGDEFRIEDPPTGADPLPIDIPEFNGKTSCFATSFYECNKLQEISFEKSRLMQLIFNRHKPHIYVSEWVAGRFDCGSIYNLWCKLMGHKTEVKKNPTTDSDYSQSEEDEDSEQPLHVQRTSFKVEQWAGSAWTKVELVLKDYPPGVKRIIFQHEGRDTQFWKGHYGSKMAGGVVKILFETIH